MERVLTRGLCLRASRLAGGRRYRLALTVERKRQLTLKLACEVLFKGQKATYRATVGLPFVTNRIEDQGHFQGAKEAFMKVKGPTENIVYSTLYVPLECALWLLVLSSNSPSIFASPPSSFSRAAIAQLPSR
jgi:hypothetical protein